MAAEPHDPHPVFNSFWTTMVGCASLNTLHTLFYFSLQLLKLCFSSYMKQKQKRCVHAHCLLHTKALAFAISFRESHYDLLWQFIDLSIWCIGFKWLCFCWGKEWEFNHTPFGRLSEAAMTVNSLIMSAWVAGETVLETQRSPSDIDSIQPLYFSQYTHNLFQQQ